MPNRARRPRAGSFRLLSGATFFFCRCRLSGERAVPRPDAPKEERRLCRKRGRRRKPPFGRGADDPSLISFDKDAFPAKAQILRRQAARQGSRPAASAQPARLPRPGHAEGAKSRPGGNENGPEHVRAAGMVRRSALRFFLPAASPSRSGEGTRFFLPEYPAARRSGNLPAWLSACSLP